MNILFALPGFHRHDRGAETALISVAAQLARTGDTVTLIGSGQDRPASPYRFLHAGSLSREKFERCPSLPALRNEYAYEELTFLPSLLRRYHPADYDVTLTCSYPFTNWGLRRPSLRRRPAHVYVTQNGDWPAFANNAEYRFFHCEGLVCTNPEYYARNKDRWFCRLIPNGIDCERFRPGSAQREKFGLPAGRLIVLMVSALIPSKRVETGIEAVGRIPDAHLVVAGDGPLRRSVDEVAAQKLPGRFSRVSLPATQMPDLYRAADVFLHLSKEESFGNVFLEAMASGLPIVAHASARLRWIVGPDELLVDTDDVQAIASAILGAQNAPRAESSRVSRAAEFAWPRVAAMYRQFLQDVVERRQAAARA